MARLSLSMTNTSTTASTGSSFSSLDPFVLTHLLRVVTSVCKSSPVLCAQLLSTTTLNNNAHDNSKDVLTLVASLLTGGTYSLPAPLPLSSLVIDVDAGDEDDGIVGSGECSA